MNLDMSGLKSWLIAGGAFLVCLLVLLTVQHFLLRKLSRWAEKTPGAWDDDLVRSAAGPLRVILILAALGFAAQTGPEELRKHAFATTGVRLGFSLAFLWLADRSLGVLMRAESLLPALGGSTRVLIHTLARFGVWSIGLLISLDTVGVSITPLLASLGVGSVAVALAAQETLSNLFSGIYILVDRPVRIGDSVRLEDGTEGVIKSVGWRSTQILLATHNIVVMPNSKIASSKLTNFNLPSSEVGGSLDAGVAYGTDLNRAESVALEVCRQVHQSTPGAVADFQPILRFLKLGESSVDFNLSFKARSLADAGLLRHELIKALHARFAKEGIEIPFPQRVVHQARTP